MDYSQIEELYQNEKSNLNYPLLNELEAFHKFREGYLRGEGDVISGLQYMDRLAEDINNKFNQLPKETK